MFARAAMQISDRSATIESWEWCVSDAATVVIVAVLVAAMERATRNGGAGLPQCGFGGAARRGLPTAAGRRGGGGGWGGGGGSGGVWFPGGAAGAPPPR